MKILISEPDNYSKEAIAIYKNLGEVKADKKLSREELLREAKDAEILVIRLAHKIDKEIFDAAKKLKIIACPTTGLDHIDLDEANKRGIKIISLKGETEFLSNVTATAELSWGLLLALIRKTSQAFDSVKKGQWDRDGFKGVELRGKTLGIIGCGRLGKMIVRYGNAFFMNVVACDPHISRDEIEKAGAKAVTMDELLSCADFISIHAPLNEETKNLIGEKEFKQMKDGAYVVNTSRGKIINEADLLNALENKKIAGAAMDVMAGEEASGKFLENNPLLEYARLHNNLLIVPHIGGATNESMRKTENFIAEKINKSNLVKTIFIVIYRGLIGRNIFRSDIFKILKNRSDLKIILFLPPGVPEYFKQEFGGENIIFEEINPPKLSRFRKMVFMYLLKHHLFTVTTRSAAWFGSGKPRRGLKEKLNYIIFWPALFILSKLPFSSKMFQYLEAKLYPDTLYDEYFDKYKPDALFVTNLLSTTDSPFIKAAKRKAVPSICLLKSWDNLDKYGMQAKVNKLLVQNSNLKKMALRWHGYKDNEVEIVGFSQFDIYTKKDLIMPRDEFFKKTGLDPNRKIIFFGSEGKWSPNDESQIDVIYKAIQESKFSSPCSLIIRPYFGDIYKDRYKPYKDRPNIYVDDSHRIHKFWPDMWDPTGEELVLFMNILRYSDVTINIKSTLALDAACLDKPIIAVRYGAFINNGRDATPDLYDHLHYVDVMKTGGLNVVDNDGELLAAIDGYLKNPILHHEGRERLRNELCGPWDGLSGKRVARHVINFLEDKK